MSTDTPIATAVARTVKKSSFQKLVCPDCGHDRFSGYTSFVIGKSPTIDEQECCSCGLKFSIIHEAPAP